MTPECKLEHQSAQPTLSVRFHAPVAQLATRFGSAYGAIARYLGELGMTPAGPAFAIHHSMDMSNLDVEAGFPVAREIPGKGEIAAGHLPEADVATTVHVGSYQDVGPSYSALGTWVQAQGLHVAGPVAEFYLNDPGTTPPSALRTKLVMPVEPT